jgi:hypothetical protein
MESDDHTFLIGFLVGGATIVLLGPPFVFGLYRKYRRRRARRLHRSAHRSGH